MTWDDYQRSIEYKNLSVGILDGQYVMERKIQSGMVSDFYKITELEYQSFSSWKEEEEKVMEIRLRNVWMRGFWGHQKFRIMKEK